VNQGSSVFEVVIYSKLVLDISGNVRQEAATESFSPKASKTAAPRGYFIRLMANG
jgi:hypothetical protein